MSKDDDLVMTTMMMMRIRRDDIIVGKQEGSFWSTWLHPGLKDTNKVQIQTNTYKNTKYKSTMAG